MRRTCVWIVAGAAMVAGLVSGAPTTAAPSEPVPDKPGLPLGLVEQVVDDAPSARVAGTDRDVRGDRRCDQPVEKDPAGDAPIDIVSVQWRSNCTNWMALFTFASPPEMWRTRFTAVELDTDMDLRNGCNGTDLLVLTGPTLATVMYGVRSCEQSGLQELDYSQAQVRGSTLRMWPTARVMEGVRHFRWFAYTIRNPGGQGNIDAVPDSVWREAATPPDPPVSLIVTHAPRGLRMSWTRPWVDGGREVTSYTVRYRPSGGTWQGPIGVRGSQRRAGIDGLQPGRMYVVEVTARTAMGRSEPITRSVQVLDRPASPAGLSTIVGADRVRLMWERPGAGGGRAVTGYEVTVDPADGDPWIVDREYPLLDQEVVAGLEPGGTYRLSVRATNGRLWSTPATVTVVIPGARTGVPAVLRPEVVRTTPPAARRERSSGDLPNRPGNLGLLRNSLGLQTVTWDPPTRPGATEIVSYRISVWRNSRKEFLDEVPASVRSYALPPVEFGGNTTVYVSAVNRAGEGPENVKDHIAPGYVAPPRFSVTVEGTSLVVRFPVPTTAAVQVQEGFGRTVASRSVAALRTVVFPDMVPGRDHTVTVRYRSSGVGSHPARVTVIVPEDAVGGA